MPPWENSKPQRVVQSCRVGARSNNVVLEHQTSKICTFDAVLTFNDGSIAGVNVLNSFRISPGRYTVQGLRVLDLRRQYLANRAAQRATKEARQAGRFITKRKRDIGDEYMAGAYWKGPSICRYFVVLL